VDFLVNAVQVDCKAWYARAQLLRHGKTYAARTKERRPDIRTRFNGDYPERELEAMPTQTQFFGFYTKSRMRRARVRIQKPEARRKRETAHPSLPR
jgi:hypothetical protein